MTKALFLCNISLVPSESLANADVAQSVERRLGKAEVTGSIPVISFTKKTDFMLACNVIKLTLA